jgi:hypothetical protein
MANSDKNIKITPNISASGQPNIVYTGSGNVPIALKVLDDSYGTLSFEGSAGQLFSLNNNLSSGTIFSVNDISGMPQFDVNADGTIRVAPYGSGVYMGGVGGGTFTIQPSAKSSSGAGTSVAITAGNGVTSGAGGSLILQAGIQATTGGDGKVVVKQTTGQTSNLQEWQNSSGSALASLDTTGRMVVPYIDVLGGTYTAANPNVRFAGGVGMYYNSADQTIRFAISANANTYIAGGGQLYLTSGGTIRIDPNNGTGSQLCILVRQNANQGSSNMFAVTGHGATTITPDLPSVSCATLNGSAAYSVTATTKVLTGNVATITCSGGSARIDVGDTIVVALSPPDAVFDGTYTVTASVKAGGTTTFSYARTNTDVASTATGGTVSSTATATLQNINIGVPGAKGLVIKAAASQTANLQEWQNSSSSILTSIGPSGGINLLPYGTSSGNTNEIRFLELAANGAHYVGFKAANTIPSNTTWILPSGDGATGQALITNGSGLLSWGTISNLSSYTNTSAGTTSAYDLGTSNFVKANPSTSGLTINGFSSSGSYDGRMLKLVNVSNYNINIINTGTTVCVGGNNIVLGPKDGADLILDSGASVWRVF